MTSTLKAILLASATTLMGCAFPNDGSVARLAAALSLFDEVNIVHNFSNMGAAFNTVALTATSPATPFPEGKQLTFYSDFDAWRIARNTTAIVVLKDGQIVFEDYYLGTSRDDKRASWSTAKSYVSTLIGIMVARGDIQSIDDPVTQYVPELIGSAYDGATIKNVLQMSSGVYFNENYMSFWSDINRMGRVLATGVSMDAFAAGIKRRYTDPGQEMRYVSIDTHVLAMVLRNATGQSLADLLSEHILQPLGVAPGGYYVADGFDVAFALGGLNLTTRDYARFGELMRLEGQYQGTRIVPAVWVAESTVPSANTVQGDLQYGYQWWIPPDAPEGEFFALGIYGQFIYVDRPNGVVVAINAADRNFLMPGVLDENIRSLRAISEKTRR